MNRPLQKFLGIILMLSMMTPASGQVYQLSNGVMVVTGKISQISKTETTLRYFIKSERKEITIVFAESTKVAGIKGLEQLKVGDDVQVEFESQDDKYVARQIFVLLAGG